MWMDEYVKVFLEYMKIEEKINVTVHLYGDKEEMHNARVDMTSDSLLKEALKSKDYVKVSGCCIIPPISEKNFDILLVESDILVYNLWHEMMHVYNYCRAIEKGWNYMAICTDIDYFHWDEFQARKVSTIMWFSAVRNLNDIEYSSQGMFDRLADTLKDEISNSEFHNAKKYNLVQYLGFIAAAEELCTGPFELPSFIAETPDILELYNKLNKKD